MTNGEPSRERENPQDFGEYLGAVKRAYEEIQRSGKDIFVMTVDLSKVLYDDVYLATLPIKERVLNEDGSVQLDEEDKEHVPKSFGAKHFKFFPAVGAMCGAAKFNLGDLLKLKKDRVVGVCFDERIDVD